MNRVVITLVVVVLLAVATPARAQFDSVGSLNFPTSGSAEAQQHFLRGVAILHSFGWKQAIAEFQAAQRIDPDFAMAYWGESLCYNHPLFGEQDGESPRQVLARLAPTPAERRAKASTEREKELLGAGEILWGAGEWRDNDCLTSHDYLCEFDLPDASADFWSLLNWVMEKKGSLRSSRRTPTSYLMSNFWK